MMAVCLLASCAQQGDAEDAELAAQTNASCGCLEKCNGLTPGFWCGGASTATEADCQSVGFDTCAEMCTCFQGANASKVDDLDCSVDCDDGMADVLQKFFGAFQLSFGTSAGFFCPAAGCSGNVCDPEEVESMLGFDGTCSSRSTLEAAKNCIDVILNDGGYCTHVE